MSRMNFIGDKFCNLTQYMDLMAAGILEKYSFDRLKNAYFLSEVSECLIFFLYLDIVLII